MKKVIVIGCPGSGKSTFSRALHYKCGIPLYHLDMLYWNSDKTTVEEEVFLQRLSEVVAGEEWIIDGNFSSTMEMRFVECDTVFFLDYPTDVCLEGVRSRRGKARPDIPWVEIAEDPEFTEFIKTYKEKRRPRVLELIEKYSDKNTFVFGSREEADEYLRNFKP